jgi:putative restriction endonuclease
MKGYVATTDYEWYRYLLSRPDIDEVNFWQPTANTAFHAIPPGSPFFFKLKSPHYAIGGFGYFVKQSITPLWLAWEAFGPANGAPDYVTMSRQIEQYLGAAGRRLERQHPIGCLMVAQPVFFDSDQWVEQPLDWQRNIVRGKAYELTFGEGKRIWDDCRLMAEAVGVTRRAVVAEAASGYGKPTLVFPRLGQGIFRLTVTDAYNRACAVTQEHSLPALEAAHIRPYSEGGEHRVSNGLLLRSDIHRLFDQGYVTVTPDYRFDVSRRLREDFSNGRSYYPLRGNRIALPDDPVARPDRDLLVWHNSCRFLG